MNMEVEIAGIKLSNPVMNASGTFGQAEYASYTDITAPGAVVAKSVTLEPRLGNPPPRIAETSCGAMNSVGIQNGGVRNFVDDKLPAMRAAGVPIIASIAGTSAEEYGEVAAILEEAEGIAAYEVNISCPNIEAGGKAFGVYAGETRRVTRIVKDAATRPVIVKLSPNVTDITEIAAAAADGGADALTIANTYLGLAVDLDTGRPVLGNVLGGLSGPAIKPITQRLVYEVRHVMDIPIIASGGIANYKDALEYLMIGANAVQAGLANLSRPDVMAEMIVGIQNFMEQRHIEDINEFIGSLRD